MRLDDERESDNVEDLRGSGGGGGGFGFGGGGGGGGGLGLLLGLVGSRFGIGGIVVVGLIALVFGINPLSFLGGGASGPTEQIGQPQAQVAGPAAPAGAEDSDKRFVRQVLASTEDTWTRLLPALANKQYVDPR
ncbi:MAG: neutral zinc metallopeptidase, partial [Janthinobacterium lividum]